MQKRKNSKLRKIKEKLQLNTQKRFNQARVKLKLIMLKVRIKMEKIQRQKLAHKKFKITKNINKNQLKILKI
jgi:hypothetical protein